jgi:hypothetical protein
VVVANSRVHRRLHSLPAGTAFLGTNPAPAAMLPARASLEPRRVVPSSSWLSAGAEWYGFGAAGTKPRRRRRGCQPAAKTGAMRGDRRKGALLHSALRNQGRCTRLSLRRIIGAHRPSVSAIRPRLEGARGDPPIRSSSR